MDQLGRIIGERYELEARLGEGGMGAVFRARDVTAGRRVAIKLLQPEIASDPVQVDRFRREAKVLRELEHPGLVRLLDASFEGGEPFLVFEVVEGKSLDGTLDGRPLELHRALTLTGLLCDAVAALHAHKILHRDLKPSNVMVRPDGSICLLDFGIAKHYGDAQRTLDHITSAGYVVGTPQYMPPEGLCGGDVLPAYDVWSIGVMFYEMVTGRRPFAESEHAVTELASALMTGRYPPASQLVPGLPKVVDACIERFLEPKASDRPADGAAALEALSELDGMTSGIRPRGSALRTVQHQQQRPPTARISRKTPLDPPTPIARASGKVPRPPPPDLPASRSPDLPISRSLAVLALLVVLGAAVGLALKPHPAPSPSPTATAAASPAPDLTELRRALAELAAWREPADLPAFLARTLSTPIDRAPDRERAQSRLRPALAAAGLERPLSRLLAGPEEPAALLATEEEREQWARLGWLAVLNHACDHAGVAWPYPKRLATQVDRHWPPIPEGGGAVDEWRHLIFRLCDPQKRDKLFGDDPNGIDFVPAPFRYPFELKEAPRAVRVWFVARDLMPSHALLVRFNGHPAVEAYAPGSQMKRAPVALRPELLRGEMSGDVLPDGRFSPLHDRGERRLRVYAGRAVPARWLKAGNNEMEVSVISLYNPLHPVKVTQPSIWAKIVSFQ